MAKKSNAKNKKDLIRSIIKKPKRKFMNEHQKEYHEILVDNQITICTGPAGVGKSYMAMKTAIELLQDEDNSYEKIIIVRPAVEAEEELGSLPGDMKEKIDPYIMPSYYLIDKIIGKNNRIKLMEEEFIDTMALGFMRGMNIDNTILIFEEAQNASEGQMKLLLTRIGFNSKFFISGDLEQSDRFKDSTKTGLYICTNKLKNLKDIGIYNFDSADIVRNPLISKILEKF